MAFPSLNLPRRTLGPWVALPASAGGWAVLVLMLLAMPLSVFATGHGIAALLVVIPLARQFALPRAS